jgi:hypothetical protein
MRDLLIDLRQELSSLCPTFLQVPPNTPTPYITIEPGQSLQGLPWGPRIAILTIKVWSRYYGTKEILMLAKGIEGLLQAYRPVSLKISESALILQKDEQTRVHRFRLKARLPGDAL